MENSPFSRLVMPNHHDLIIRGTDRYATACCAPGNDSIVVQDILEQQELAGGWLSGPTELQKLIAFIEGPVVIPLIGSL